MIIMSAQYMYFIILFHFSFSLTYKFLMLLQVKAINDTMDYKVNGEAMTSVGFSAEEKTTIWKIVAAILHLVSSCFK